MDEFQGLQRSGKSPTDWSQVDVARLTGAQLGRLTGLAQALEPYFSRDERGARTVAYVALADAAELRGRLGPLAESLLSTSAAIRQALPNAEAPGSASGARWWEDVSRSAFRTMQIAGHTQVLEALHAAGARFEFEWAPIFDQGTPEGYVTTLPSFPLSSAFDVPAPASPTLRTARELLGGLDLALGRAGQGGAIAEVPPRESFPGSSRTVLGLFPFGRREDGTPASFAREQLQDAAQVVRTLRRDLERNPPIWGDGRHVELSEALAHLHQAREAVAVLGASDEAAASGVTELDRALAGLYELSGFLRTLSGFPDAARLGIKVPPPPAPVEGLNAALGVATALLTTLPSE